MKQVGFQRRTDDGIIGTSGQPVALYGYSIESGATAGVVIFRNGSAVTASEVFRDTGTASQGEVQSFGGVGVVFPDGLFVDIDANVTAVIAFYESVRTT